MRMLLKILVVPASVGLMGGVANAAPANLPLNERETSAQTEVTPVHYRHWHGYRYRPYGYYYRPYYRPYRYRYRPYGYYYRPYYYRPYYYHPRRYHRPRVRFHLGVGF
jgi:hypothetical protein